VTWRRSLWLSSLIMSVLLAIGGWILSRLYIPGETTNVMNVRSIFPAGGAFRVPDAKNNWQGFGFAGNFRFFSRPSPEARNDLRKLAEENFSRSRWKKELALFDGGIYALKPAGKGYLMFCLFSRRGTDYWADMRSGNSLDFGRRAFERFIVNLEIEGEKAAPEVQAQVAALARGIPWFFMQSLAQLLGAMAVAFMLIFLIQYRVNLFGGSCPNRGEPAAGICTPQATLRQSVFRRRRIAACCLCQEGDLLVIYRFRRPFRKIALQDVRRNVIWGKSSFRYRDIRLILNYADFQRWRTLLMD
jgi:hypothetical protein